MLMAKRKARRKFRRYIKGRMDGELALGALNPNAAVSTTETNVLEEKAWLSSTKLTWAMDEFTPQAGDGPIWVGVAHSDYTTAEIEAWIESSTSWSQGDKISQEINRRKIRQVGVFTTPPDTATAVVLNDGRPITTKCGWQLTTGQTVRIWAYNTGLGVLTTGGLVHINGHANLWPN